MGRHISEVIRCPLNGHFMQAFAQLIESKATQSLMCAEWGREGGVESKRVNFSCMRISDGGDKVHGFCLIFAPVS